MEAAAASAWQGGSGEAQRHMRHRHRQAAGKLGWEGALRPLDAAYSMCRGVADAETTQIQKPIRPLVQRVEQSTV